MIHGVINVYKERGFTSHDVVAKLRGITHQKKIGHTGTLDPEAEGVLLVCFGAATRICSQIEDWTKAYHAECLLGLRTDTQDLTGKVLEERPVTADAGEILRAAASFAGSYEQVPPMYSALKVGGKHLYELARQGKEVERKARTVTIHSIRAGAYDAENQILPLDVVCSKGTYIRTLCEDLGQKLGCGAAMKSLVRTGVGTFTLESARTLAQIQALQEEGRLSECLIPVDALFQDLRALTVTAEGERLLKNGNPLRQEDISECPVLEEEEQIRLYDTRGGFQALYRFEKKRRLLVPQKMFLTE